jgi:D-alanine transaminase
MSYFFYDKNSFIPVLDRGLLFGDAVYEVFAVLNGKILEQEAHIARLSTSLKSVKLFSPVPLDEIDRLQKDLIQRDSLREGMIYLQITRGCVAERDFSLPKAPNPNFIMFTQEKKLIDSHASVNGIRVITVPDLRWKRRDIKTVQLLGACLAKQEAIDAGKDDAWMEEDNFITEGSASNAFIIKNDALITRQLGTEILPGITRKSVLEFAQQTGLRIEERAFTVDEAMDADEAFMTAATAFVTPVVEVNGQSVGSGKPGELTKKMRNIYIDMALNS